jgi:hypothetical protein
VSARATAERGSRRERTWARIMGGRAESVGRAASAEKRTNALRLGRELEGNWDPKPGSGERFEPRGYSGICSEEKPPWRKDSGSGILPGVW